MIQRIQSLYLLLVVVLQIILLFSRIATVSMEGGEELVYNTLDFWAMAILAGISALLAFISIFLFRKRLIQIRINIYNAIILLALQGYLVYYLIGLTRQVEIINYSIPDVFPVISAILTFLAIRSIGKDEALIKALNRIR